VVVGFDYGRAGQMTVDEIAGSSPVLCHEPSPAAMARACRPRTSSRERASRITGSPSPQTTHG
jgi:hypothetical protein